jgi:hypothetical protein
MRSREDAVRTGGASGWLFTSSLVRMWPRRESSLGAVCGGATGERRGDVLRTSGASATSRMSWRRRVARARSRAQGVVRLTGRSRRGDVRCIRARTDAEVLLPGLSCFATPTPNQSMKLTAGSSAINF